MMPQHDCPIHRNATLEAALCPAPSEVSQMTTLDYLEKLLAFDSTSAHPNAGLIDWVQAQVGVNGTDHLIQL